MPIAYLQEMGFYLFLFQLYRQIICLKNSHLHDFSCDFKVKKFSSAKGGHTHVKQYINAQGLNMRLPWICNFFKCKLGLDEWGYW